MDPKHWSLQKSNMHFFSFPGTRMGFALSPPWLKYELLILGWIICLKMYHLSVRANFHAKIFDVDQSIWQDSETIDFLHSFMEEELAMYVDIHCITFLCTNIYHLRVLRWNVRPWLYVVPIMLQTCNDRKKDKTQPFKFWICWLDVPCTCKLTSKNK